MDAFRNASSRADVARAISASRRDFLRLATGATLGSTLFGCTASAAPIALSSAKKVVVVTFGGGSRDDETFSEDGIENIPHLLNELLPRGTFFTRVINRGILGHYVATASLATGAYETFNNFAAVSPDHPTVFEYFRRDLKRPVTDTWVVAPSNGFNRIGESSHRSYGEGDGAGVILPKRLLSAALNGDEADYEHLLRDNYESPLASAAEGGTGVDLHELAGMLRLSVQDFKTHARNLTSPDELSVYIARQLMRELAPSLLWITLHDIDVAHSGAFSLYVDAIKRSDSLCGQIWKTIQSEPEYAGKTALFILPDFGRDSDMSVGGNGFQHHRTGDIVSRTTWMLALGPGIRENVVVDRPVSSIDLVPTLGARLGFSRASPKALFCRNSCSSMTPASLAASEFANYRPLARQTALGNLALLQKLPPALVPFLLREIISLDWKFPAEREELLGQFAYLKSLSPARLNAEMAGFNRLHLSPQLESFNWANSPELFVEQFSAFLWSSNQMDSFRASSEQYMRGFRASRPEGEPSVPRVVLVLFGSGANTGSDKLGTYKLFRKLRRQGTYFSALAPGNHLPIALEFLAARSASHLDPYAHWLIDGSAANAPGSTVNVSFDALAGLRSKLTAEISAAFQSHSSPEALRTKLASTTPADLGMSADPRDELLNRFKVSLFTEGSGTQIYSTTFVQWTAREALRRARPVTLVARFTPRRRETSMQEMLTGTAPANYDPTGSLLDGDMGAWYTWIDLQRLPGSKTSVLIACFEGHTQAVAVGPAFPAASENHAPMNLRQLLKS